MDRRVLFICTGNVCRSPMAEYLFRDLMSGDHDWEAASAGTAAWDGNPASDNAIRVLADWNIDLTTHRSRRLRPDMIAEAEHILVMTAAQQSDIAACYPHAADRIRTLREFDSGAPSPDIDDPIGASLDVYLHVRDEIKRCLLDLILFLKGK